MEGETDLVELRPVYQVRNPECSANRVIFFDNMCNKTCGNQPVLAPDQLLLNIQQVGCQAPTDEVLRLAPWTDSGTQLRNQPCKQSNRREDGL